MKVPKPSDQAYVVATVADRLGSKVLVKLGKVPEVQMFKKWVLFTPHSVMVTDYRRRQLRTYKRR